MQSAEISIENIRKDFPILERKVGDNKPLIYLDNVTLFNVFSSPRVSY